MPLVNEDCYLFLKLYEIHIYIAKDRMILIYANNNAITKLGPIPPVVVKEKTTGGMGPNLYRENTM